jgi:site-specific DNA-cytosine methylase
MANPIRVVSLFCGIGGADLGLYRAAADLGIEVEVVAAIDSWDKAVAVYNANLPHPAARVADVKTLQRTDLPPHDLVIGGPPCQPFSLAGKREGHDDPRNCLPDFMRLVGDAPYIMENVAARLIPAPFSVKLQASDFGDVTSRKRWFYSDHLLNVIPTPGPRRIRDIRDHAEDARVLAKRCGCKAGSHQHYDDTLDTLSAHSWHGHDIRGSGNLVGIWTGDEMKAALGDDDVFATFTGSAFHGTKNNGSGQPTKGSKVRIGGTPAGDDDFMPFVTSGHGGVSGYPMLRLGLRGNSASASAFDDDEVLGSLLSNAFHANEASKLEGCRNPSLLEMARAHSIPDDFDWCGATKTAKGKMVANSWPVGMAAGVCRAMLIAIGALEKAA